MKRILVVLLFLLLPSIGLSDEYVLVMSKDDSVCQHMLKIYNEDLKKFGKIKYDQHEEFKAIRWEQKRYVWQFHGSSRPGVLTVSRLDINNDGKREVVLKMGDVGLKGEPSDNIFIFNEKDIDTFTDEIVLTEELTNKAIDIFLGGALGRRRNVYTLQELPIFEILSIDGTKFPLRYSLGGWFYFHLFLYNREYFMYDWYPGIDKHWEVVLRYSPENQLRDVCYFLKVCSSKNE